MPESSWRDPARLQRQRRRSWLILAVLAIMLVDLATAIRQHWTLDAWLAGAVILLEAAGFVAARLGRLPEFGRSATPAGWYPQEFGDLRYWDGHAWTELVPPAPRGDRDPWAP